MIFLDYKGVECPVCKKVFTDNDDIVVCPECGTPHHRECWFSLSHCVNEQKHSDSFEYELPRIKQIENEILNANLPEGGNDITPIPQAVEPQTQGQSGPVFQAPILGGMGKLGIDFGSNPTIADIPLEEAIAFVGDDSSSSRLLFKLTMIDKFKSLRLNFVVLFFPYLWFFYRKMYKVGAIVMALMLFVTAAFTNSNTLKYQQRVFSLYMQAAQGEISVEDYNAAMLKLQQEGTGNSYIYELAPQVLNLVIRIFFAIMANKLYLEHMKKQVLKIREECSSMDEYMAALKRKGGKSVGAAILSLVCFGILNTGLLAALYAVFIK